MVELIRKDILLNSKTLMQLAAFAGIAILAFSRLESGMAFVVAWSMMIPYSYALMSCYTEELNKGLAFCRSLPISASTIVWSKFASATVVTLASGAYLFVLGRLASYLGWLRPDPSLPFGAALTLPWVAVFVIQGVFLLLFFAYGYKRAQSITTMLPLLFLIPLVLPQPIRTKLSASITALFGGTPDLRSILPSLVALAFGIDVLLTWRASKVFEAKDIP